MGIKKGWRENDDVWESSFGWESSSSRKARKFSTQAHTYDLESYVWTNNTFIYRIIAHKFSKNCLFFSFLSFITVVLCSLFCNFCLMGLSFWNKLGWMVWVWWGLNLFYSLETNDRALVSSYFGLVFYFEYYMQTLFVCLDVVFKVRCLIN